MESNRTGERGATGRQVEQVLSERIVKRTIVGDRRVTYLECEVEYTDGNHATIEAMTYEELTNETQPTSRQH